jgi:hypothetical protein
MSSIGSALDSVRDSTGLRYEINYPQKLWISRGLAILEGKAGRELRLIGYFLLKMILLLVQGIVQKHIANISDELFIYTALVKVGNALLLPTLPGS